MIRLLCSAAALAAMFFASASTASAAPPSLTGEVVGIAYSAEDANGCVLHGAISPEPLCIAGYTYDASGRIQLPGSMSLDYDCPTPGDGQGTINYEATGRASGPYPGTWSEKGSLRIGPVSSAVSPDSGQILSASATFQIASSVGKVDGRRFINEPLPLGFANRGYCNKTYAPDPPVWLIFWIAYNARYSATIQTADGLWAETGQAPYRGLAGNLWQHPDGHTPASSFDNQSLASTFMADTPTPTAISPTAVALTPSDATGYVSTSHTVSATARDSAGNALPNFKIVFDVSGSTNSGGSCTTAATGSCSYTYTGPDLPGADEIKACADANASGTIEQGEPCSRGTQAWLLPSATAGHVTGGGQIPNDGNTDQLAFGFHAKSDGHGFRGRGTLVDPSTSTFVELTEVTSMVQTPSQATIFGNAIVDGAPTTYRLDVADNADPGAGWDVFRFRTANGYLASGTLSKGNIKIH